MNKTKFKKFLTLLICLMLISSLFLLAACKPDPETPDDGGGSTTTKNPSFSNGNFSSVTSTDSDYPRKPTNWSGAPTSNPVNLPELSNYVCGVISLGESVYNANKSKWGDLPLFGKYTEGLGEEYTKDDDVLMIYNKQPSYYLYKSGSFTAAANSYYKLTVDVKTANLGGGDEKGVNMYLYDYSANVGLAAFETVASDSGWTRYTFYVKTKHTSSTLQLKLMLGKETTDSASPDLTSGYAFFDNVTFEAVEDGAKTLKTVTENDTTMVVDLSVPNPDFDFVTSSTTIASTPALYDRASDADSNAKYGRINIDGAKFSGNAEYIGLPDTIVNPGYAGDLVTRYPNIYALYNSSDLGNVLGFKTKSALYFKRGNAYKISIWVNTQNVTSGKALIALSPKSENLNDALTQEIDRTDGWQQHSFFVLANQNTALELYFQFWLGNGDNKASGTAFFDGLTVEQLDLTDKTFEEHTQGVNAGLIKNDTTKEEDSLLDNGYFSGDNGTNGWLPLYDKNGDTVNTGVLNGVVNDMVVKEVVTADGENVTTPYSSITNNVMKITSDKPTLYTLGYNTYLDTNRTIGSLKAYTAYRFSVWVKTVDLKATSGVVLTVYNGINKANRTAIATYNSLNTTDLKDSEGLNGYRELVCYFYTGDTAEEISFEIAFGSGSNWTSDTLFKGTAYVANVSLIETTYAKFNSASASGTYEKKHNYNKYASTSYSNGQFDNYNMDKTDGFQTSGIVDEKFTGNFGAPQSWDLVKHSSLTHEETLVNAESLFAGIVDFNRENDVAADTHLKFITKLKAAMTAQGLSTDMLNLENLMYKPADDTTNLELFDYVGEHSALMLASPNQTLGDKGNFVSMGYTTSSTISLAADTYYEISVLVKAIGTTRASVYLMTDNRSEAAANSNFTNITATTDNTTKGWVKYTFRIKVGFSSTDVQLGLYLGQSDNPEDTIADGTETGYGGIVFFDRVTKTEIKEEVFNAEFTDTDLHKVKQVYLNVDGFGLAATKTHTGENYIVPASGTWSGNPDISNDDSNKYGIIINDKYNFDEHAPGLGLQDVLKGHNNSNSALVINNNVAGAYHFQQAKAKTFAKDSYYKVSVWAKTFGVEADKNGYIKLLVTDNSSTIGSETIYFNTGDTNEYKQFVFYVKSPEKNALSSSVKLVLGLGEVEGDVEKLVQGIAVFDDVEFVKIEKAAYDEAKAQSDENPDNSIEVLEYKDKTSSEVKPETPPTTPESNKQNLRWLIFGSVAFGAIIVIVVVVYFLKKYLPKRPQREKKVDVKKEDKYKDLND